MEAAGLDFLILPFSGEILTRCTLALYWSWLAFLILPYYRSPNIDIEDVQLT